MSGTTTPVIEVEHLVTYYGQRRILNDVSLVVLEGEILVIMGGSGSGKSTLLRHMMGLERPSAGVVRVLGKDLTRLSREEAFDLHQTDGGQRRDAQEHVAVAARGDDAGELLVGLLAFGHQDGGQIAHDRLFGLLGGHGRPA